MASGPDGLRPLLGVYAQDALEGLRAARSGARLTETVAALDPLRVALPGVLLLNVNTPEGLAEAEEALRVG